MNGSRRDLLKFGGALSATALLPATFGLSASGSDHSHSKKSRTFVLVHGSWFGSWVWNDLADILRRQGHKVFTPTLTGLGDRKHLLSDEINVSSHIQDLITHIEVNRLTNIDLVGWSYGGMVVTGALDALRSRLNSVTYLDAFVPRNGQAIVDFFGPEGERLYGPNRDKKMAVNPIPLQLLGVSNQSLIRDVAPRLSPHPWRTYFEKVQVTSDLPRIPFTYVLCRNAARSPFEPFYNFAKSARWMSALEIQSSHLCMMEKPEEVAEILVGNPK